MSLVQYSSNSNNLKNIEHPSHVNYALQQKSSGHYLGKIGYAHECKLFYDVQLPPRARYVAIV